MWPFAAGAKRLSGDDSSASPLRQARRTRDEFERELAVHQLRERLKLLESSMEIGEQEVDGAVAAERKAAQEGPQEKRPGRSARSEIDLIREAKACLMV